MNTRASVLTPDGPAVVLSSLCILHCLALPVLASLVPTLGVWFDHEWIHRGLVLLAIPFTATALLQGGLSGRALGFAIGATAGLALLLAAAFVESLHDSEALLTVIGALILASAHIWRWTMHRSARG
ncbi:MAG: MerC domain-containing protein [Pseudomonadota bacterium]